MKNKPQKEKIYDWDSCPNISILSPRVVWWNEEEICLREHFRYPTYERSYFTKNRVLDRCVNEFEKLEGENR